MVGNEELKIIADSIHKGKFLDRDYYKNYHQMFFSVFDHWLKENEIEEIIIYQEVKSSKDQKISEMYYAQEEKILNFFKEIFRDFSLYLYKPDTKDFLKIAEKEALIKNCLDALRKDKFSIIYLAELDIFFRGNYDFTFLMYMKDKNKIEKIKKSLDNNQLHILS